MHHLKSPVKWLFVSGLLVICQIDPGHCQTDPCVDHKFINMHEGRRESTYQPESTDQLPCDDEADPDSWVRFVRDGLSYQVASTDCIEVDHCGTSSPMYIRGQSAHPTAVGINEKAKVCLNFGNAICCGIIGDATIRLCEDRIGEKFYVYKLPKASDCSSSYCVDPVTGSCPPKFKRGPDDTCILIYPPQDRPTLEGPIIEGSTFNFYCAAQYSGPTDLSADARFEITFLFDGLIDQTIPVATVEVGGKALLNEQHLKGHIGADITCESTPFWQFSQNDKGDPYRSSDGYFLGVRAENNRLTVSEEDDRPGEVVLRATFPVLSKDPNKVCRACTRVVTEGALAVSSPQCEYCFTSEDWVPEENRAYDRTSPLRVRAVKNTRFDNSAKYYIDFEPFVYTCDEHGSSVPNKDSVWDGYEMNDILVTYEDSTQGRCSATGDPHITSFDGKYFHVFHIGQFVMWKSNAARYLEVHARFWQCGRTVSCVCGVVVREGNAILGVDICGSPSLKSFGRIKVTKYSPPSWTLPTGAFVSSDNSNKYYINMPSGSYVRVDNHRRALNIFIFALAEDKSKSSGLCGNFDGDSKNDLKLKGSDKLDPSNDQTGPIPVQFSESYRIPAHQSLFDSTPKWLNLPDPDAIKCRCNQGTIDCSPGADVEGSQSSALDKIKPLQTKDKENGASGSTRRRRKRDVDRLSDDIDEEEDNFIYGEDFEPNTEFSWPTQSGLTEEQARAYCQSKLNALPYTTDCLTKTKTDIGQSIQPCMEDMQITDNKTWASASVDGFETACQFLALQNRSLYTIGEDNKLKPPAQILGKICPNQCSGRGTCVKGTCECTPGFTGVDCSLQEGAAPLLHYIPGPGRCDLTKRLCKEFRLIASQFKKTEQLTCRVAELRSKVTVGGGVAIVSHDSTITTVSEGTATFITTAEIACKLPDIASQDMAFYQVLFDFTYDGEKYSNRLTMTIFDGECLECKDNCDKAENWKMLSNSCIIDGRCAISGDLYSEKLRCFTCYPDKSQNSWTEVPATRCGLEVTTTSTSGGVVQDVRELLMTLCLTAVYCMMRTKTSH